MGGASAIPRGLYTTPNTPPPHSSSSSISCNLNQPGVPVRSDIATRVRLRSGDWRTQSELYFRMKREVQSSIRVTPMPKLNREPPPRWRSPDSQVATASSVLYLAQSGWLMTPALLMTGSTDVQPVCSSPIVKIRNRIRISSSQRRLCVNWLKVLQQADVHLIAPLFFQRIVNEKLIYNTNRVDQY